MLANFGWKSLQMECNMRYLEIFMSKNDEWTWESKATRNAHHGTKTTHTRAHINQSAWETGQNYWLKSLTKPRKKNWLNRLRSHTNTFIRCSITANLATVANEFETFKLICIARAHIQNYYQNHDIQPSGGSISAIFVILAAISKRQWQRKQ